MRELLVAVPGVQQALVNFDESVAVVHYDASATSIEEMCAALAARGYQSWSTDTETRHPAPTSDAAVP